MRVADDVKIPVVEGLREGIAVEGGGASGHTVATTWAGTPTS